MPHIAVSGCNTTMNLQQLNIHAELVFKKEFFNTPRQRELLLQIQSEIEAVCEKYFDEIDSEDYTNHEWNQHK